MIAEPLGAEVVGHAATAQDGQHFLGDLGRLRQGQSQLAEADGEAVARQVAWLELVRVAGGLQDANFREGHLLELLGRDVLDRDPLPGDRLGVFQARQADVPPGDVQGSGDAVQGLPRADPFLLDQGVNVGAGAAGRVQGQLLHEEILRPGLDDAADAGQIRRKKW